MKNRGIVEWISFILVIIGGINWGLDGLFQINVVQGIFGYIPGLVRIIYILVGIAAVYLLVLAIKKNKTVS